MNTDAILNWLRRIFSLSTISTIAVIISTCLSIIEYTQRDKGELIALFNDEKICNIVNRTSLVYLDGNKVDIRQYNMLPQLLNPTKYAMKDTHIEYTVNCNKAKVEGTDFYSIHRVSDKLKLSNSDKTLYAQTEFPEPFSLMQIYDGGFIDVEIRASYQGMEQPFKFNTHIVANKIWNSDVKKRRINILANAYNYAKNHSLDYVDVYIAHGERVEIMCGLSKEKLKECYKTELSDSKGQGKIKTTSEISEVTKKSVQKAKEDYKSPWYVGVLLFVLMIVCGLFSSISIFFLFCDKNKFKYALCSTFFLFVFYVSMYYFFEIIDYNIIDNFWTGFLFLLIAVAVMSVFIALVEFFKKKFGVSDDSSAGGVIFFVLLIIFALIILLIKYLFDLFDKML